VLLAGGAGGCEVTPKKIAAWKETERGPRKLREALGRSSLQPALRGQALAALVELGMTAEVEADLKGIPEAERQAVAHEAVPRLGALLGPAGAAEPTTRTQREAKDALFVLRDHTAVEDRARIDDLLIAWTTADLNGRMTQGGQGSEKILVAIGQRAAPRLIELIRPGSPSVTSAAALLGRIADEPTRTRATDTLVAALRSSSAQATSEGLLQALGQLGGPHATAYLVEAAEHGTERSRELALLSLAQGKLDRHDSVARSAALRIAGEKQAPGKVREAAFQLAEKLGAPAVSGLIKLMADPDETTRWRAVEAALAAGREQAIAPVLEALSPERGYKKDDLDSYVVHDLGLIGASAAAPLRDELKSKSWVARVVAVRGLATVGRSEDAAALSPLESDGTRLKGFPGGATLGSEAKAAAVALRAKR
jgi:HEAT repeat protein